MSQEERLMILQMVSEKKISVEEATELLRAIEPGKKEQTTAGSGTEDVCQPGRSASFGSGLGSFIEDIVERVTSAVSEAVEPRFEFPSELTGEFSGGEVPVKILTGNGQAELRAWDEPGYKAIIVVKARGANEDEARKRAEGAYTVEHGPSGFSLESTRRFMDGGDVAVNVTLMVPRSKRYKLETRTGNGRVELVDVNVIDGRVTSGNGRITCRGGQADKLFLRSGNGSIAVEADVAELEAGSGNGSVTVIPQGGRSQTLKLSTGNGSVQVDTRRLVSGVGYKVEAHTGMGSVSVDLPDLVFNRNVRSMANKHVIATSAKYEEAAARVDINARTGMGSVTIG